ncbi:ring-cleaving dioxygenase [Halocatena pleomorpha]|uniref:Ring-cleaving dioxygenase n=1 Tax=Halocatena pleomorpha TaxID=1785090 RepID=A0A3P3RLL0_9EURY|nr:ring-cleaving dioxygenase [Halocatena pleomorpha]RRJ33788.1 ring-cleaving dioxygenase [Halocatena pleomorpha]
MAPTTPGLHHVTAIASDPQVNAEFYVDTLGLRFVKKTVNHDDTYTYHFYFGDGEGTPGTNLTFFPWGDRGRSGQFGAGQTKTTAYAVPPDSLGYWIDRLESHGVDVTEPTERFGETVIAFDDPDGISLALVATDDAPPARPWEASPVPESHQLRGLNSVTLAVNEIEPTADVLTTGLGYEFETEEDGRHRYRAAGGGPGSAVDLLETDRTRGRSGVGTVHHVAYKAQDTTEQQRWREHLIDQNLRVSEIIDRTYFQSIYFREPGGVLFEIATTGPGFTVDQTEDELGTDLALPEWLEHERAEIESHLPSFETPPKS